MSECYNCGESEAKNTVTINNSEKEDGDYLTDDDVDFDVDFSGHPEDPEMEVVSVTLCDACSNDL